jgi:small basic protein (TIGR04137 family)
MGFREKHCAAAAALGSERVMSIDKSLRRKNQLARARSVLNRGERIKTLQETDRWTEGRSPYGLPKVRVQKVVTKKPKKEKVAAEGAEGAAAPAEGAAAEKAAPAKGAPPKK